MTDKLHRVLSRWDGIAVTVSSVIGVGIFAATGKVYRAAGGSGGALAMWVALGLLTLAGSFVYADLAVRVPEAGGPYAYVRQGFGRFPAFMDGWITLGAGNPALQAGGCALIGEFVCELLGWGAFAKGWRGRGIGMIAVLFLAAINWIGVRAGARSQRFFTSFKLVALAGVILLALVPVHTPPPVLAIERLSLVGGLAAAWYTYAGWQDGALLAEDLRDPRRDLKSILVGSVLIIVIVYVAVNAAILWAARGTPIASAERPAILIAERVLGTTGIRLMSAVILVSMLGGTAEGFMVHPRLGFALARDRLAPRVLGRVNRGGTPSGALAFHCVVIIALLVTGGFDVLTRLILFTQAVQAVLESSSYFVLRSRVPGPQLTPGHPIVPGLFIGANLAMAGWVAWDNPRSVLYGAAVIAFAAVAYGVYRLLE